MDDSPVMAREVRVPRMLTRPDAATQLAIVCVIFGWFFLNTLVVNLGSLQHGVRFYDMSAVIADPTRLFFGVDVVFQRVWFGALCILCVLAPLASSLSDSRWIRLTHFAPLVLMVLFALLLNSRTSGELFVTPTETTSLSGSVLNMANDLVRRGTGLVSRHVSAGAGGYLSLIGSVILASRGIRHFHAR